MNAKPMKVLLLLLLGTTILVSTPRAHAQGDVHQAGLQWTPATLFPSGALLAILSGDPARPGQTTAALSLPDGYRVPPHFHPMDQGLEVKQGTLLIGIGEHVDLAKTDTLLAGDTVLTPAGTRQYWVARGPTVVVLTFDGPYTITYVNAYEAPRSVSFPYP